MMRLDYEGMFSAFYPGFFEEEGIRSRSADAVFSELALDLAAYPDDAAPVRCPEGITFGLYRGDMGALREIVRTVEESWVPFYTQDSRAFCAFDGERVVSFCLLDRMGDWQGLRVAGPGCVGTVPERRGRGTGLRMVQLATLLLKREGYDLSWIHYTHIGRWYEKLGYQTVLRWNARGLLPAEGEGQA